MFFCENWLLRLLLVNQIREKSQRRTVWALICLLLKTERLTEVFCLQEKNQKRALIKGKNNRFPPPTMWQFTIRNSTWKRRETVRTFLFLLGTSSTGKSFLLSPSQAARLRRQLSTSGTISYSYAVYRGHSATQILIPIPPSVHPGFKQDSNTCLQPTTLTLTPSSSAMLSWWDHRQEQKVSVVDRLHNFAGLLHIVLLLLLQFPYPECYCLLHQAPG